MRKFRVDYVTTDGKRGVWHYEVEASGGEDEVKAMCDDEFVSIRSRLRRFTGAQLATLVVVELVEIDVRVIGGP